MKLTNPLNDPSYQDEWEKYQEQTKTVMLEKFKAISEAINQPIDWVEKELNKGPTSDSSIWKLMENAGVL